jgi:hypothetical protein
MAFGFPHISFIGYPLSVPCAGHADLGFRQAGSADGPAILAHYRELSPADRRMRFCATLTDSALERHVGDLFRRSGFVLTAHDGPLWAGPFHGAGPVRAVAEVGVAGREAEIGLSVGDGQRRRGVGTYLLQTVALLLAQWGVDRLRAYTLPGNVSFLGLARESGAAIEAGPGEVEVVFDVARLRQAYLCRRAAESFRRAA